MPARVGRRRPTNPVVALLSQCCTSTKPLPWQYSVNSPYSVTPSLRVPHIFAMLVACVPAEDHIIQYLAPDRP